MNSELNQEQWEAVKHGEGPLLVLAGAGSGKTRIVTYRILHLIKSGVSPSQILAVTFTNKAAGEMLERIQRMTQMNERPLLCTFHSLGARILRESAEFLGYQNNFVIYDEEDSIKLLKKSFPQFAEKGEEAKAKALKALISHAKNELLGASEIELPHELENLFPEVYNRYQENLKASNALDFDDLLYLPVKLFREHPDILEAYQKKWPYLLIDEYQDTNQAQYLLTRLLVEKSQNLFVVGDPDQSIYSWRGANIKNILNFERDYPKAKVVRLEQNYRSRKNILDAANALIENNHGRYKKNLWSTRGQGEKISLYVAPTEREEAAFVVYELERLHSELNIPYNEIAIFYRTNFQSRTFEDFLLRAKIPYVIVGGISFYHRKEIKDILSFLHMVEGDNDYIAFARTINLPKRGIGDTTIDKIRILAKSQNISLMALTKNLVDGVEKGIKLTEKQREGLKGYLSLILDLRALAKDENVTLQKLVQEVIRKANYLEMLREEKETFDDRKSNLEELISKAAEYEGELNLSKFLEELSLKGSLDEADLNQDRLSLMTFHNGKGLEFGAVFLVGMEEDLFPHANSRGNHESIEEERRLCYVGMTRAKERLYLTAAETRFLWGTSRTMRPSRFLKEIPREYIDRMR